MEEEKMRLSKPAIIIIFLFIFLLGLTMMIYPIIAANYAESVRSEIQTNYEEVINEADTSEIDKIKLNAEEYNFNLFTGVFSPLEFEENGYYEQLNLPDTEVMCYIIIPKIDIYLPVYHGVGTKSLDKGAGHMEQSSLPVGGINTHAVISAHSGMAQSPMFSDLELLEIGDVFQIQVLDERMSYEVEAIDVVLPQEVDAIKIQRDKDLVSLVTCTPYGVNSHRLVVRGHRIENPVDEVSDTIVQEEAKDTASIWTDQYWRSVKTGAYIALSVIAFLSISFLFVLLHKKQGSGGMYEE